MASKKIHTIQYRRKREGKTNYKKRLELLKGKRNRLVIRKTNTQIILQIIKYETNGDKILSSVHSKELQTKYSWTHSCKNLPAAYLSGLLLAKKAKSNKLTEAILDLGLQFPLKGSKLYAALKGVTDGGFKIPLSKEIFPAEERIKGEPIAKYSDKQKNITQDFEKIKTELMK